jgi:4-azaleucine resistance transporter AzlC
VSTTDDDDDDQLLERPRATHSGHPAAPPSTIPPPPGLASNFSDLRPPPLVSWSREGIVKGIRTTTPVALSLIPFGLAFGTLAKHAGIGFTETVLMSGLVFAGAAQFAALGMWSEHVPVMSIVFMTLVLNLRHILMGITLHPWLSKIRRRQSYFSLFFLSDESWVLSVAYFHSGGHNAAFLLGSGSFLFTAWVVSTTLGRFIGSAIAQPERWGLDFTFPATFLFLLTMMWKGRGKRNLIPWTIAAVTALVVARYVPGKWFVLCGALAGSLAGALEGKEAKT